MLGDHPPALQATAAAPRSPGSGRPASAARRAGGLASGSGRRPRSRARGPRAIDPTANSRHCGRSSTHRRSVAISATDRRRGVDRPRSAACDRARTCSACRSRSARADMPAACRSRSVASCATRRKAWWASAVARSASCTSATARPIAGCIAESRSGDRGSAAIRHGCRVIDRCFACRERRRRARLGRIPVHVETDRGAGLAGRDGGAGTLKGSAAHVDSDRAPPGVVRRRRRCRWRLSWPRRAAVETGEVDRHAVGDQFGRAPPGSRPEDRGRAGRPSSARCGRRRRI